MPQPGGGTGGQGDQGGSLPAPPQQSALTLWLAAEDLDTLGDGDTVASWVDRSSAGCDVSGQAPGTLVFQSTALNGGPGVAFDGTDDYLAGAGKFGLVGDAAFTALTVLNLRSSNRQAYYPLVWLWGDPNARGGTSSLEVKNDSLVWATGWMWDAEQPRTGGCDVQTTSGPRGLGAGALMLPTRSSTAGGGCHYGLLGSLHPPSIMLVQHYCRMT